MKFIVALSLLATAVLGTSASAVSPRGESDEVVLGDPALTAGVPGVGLLTAEVLDAWLKNPANHKTLKVQLPAGLDAAQANVYIPENNPMTRAKIELDVNCISMSGFLPITPFPARRAMIRFRAMVQRLHSGSESGGSREVGIHQFRITEFLAKASFGMEELVRLRNRR